MAFTWGDAVRIESFAPAELRPGAWASVCGIRVIEKENEASAVGYPLGTTMYLVEFEDGHSVEVPEALLAPDESGHERLPKDR